MSPHRQRRRGCSVGLDLTGGTGTPGDACGGVGEDRRAAARVLTSVKATCSKRSSQLGPCGAAVCRWVAKPRGGVSTTGCTGGATLLEGLGVWCSVVELAFLRMASGM
jgi:hypothetical protein